MHQGDPRIEMRVSERTRKYVSISIGGAIPSIGFSGPVFQPAGSVFDLQMLSYFLEGFPAHVRLQ